MLLGQQLGLHLGQPLAIRRLQGPGTQQIDLGRQAAAMDGLHIGFKGTGGLQGGLPDRHQGLTQLQLPVGAGQLKARLPLALEPGSAAGRLLGAAGGHLGQLAQGQQIEIQHHAGIAEAVAQHRIAVLLQGQGDVPQGGQVGEHPHRGAHLGVAGQADQVELRQQQRAVERGQGRIPGHLAIGPHQLAGDHQPLLQHLAEAQRRRLG